MLRAPSLLVGMPSARNSCRVIVTASEDRTCGFWDAHTGRLLQRVRMHRGRGVWCCAAVGAPELAALLTGGGDGALRLWSLPAWLAPRSVALLRAQLQPSAVGSREAQAGNRQSVEHEGSAQGNGDCNREPCSSGQGASGTRLSLPRVRDRSSNGFAAAVSAVPLTSEAANEAAGRTPSDSVRAMTFAGPRRLYVVTTAGALHVAKLAGAHSTASAAGTSFAPVAVWQTAWVAPAGDAPLNCVAAVERSSSDVGIVGAQSGHVTMLSVDCSGEGGEAAVHAQLLARVCLQPGLPVLGLYGLQELPWGQLLVGATTNVLHWVAMPALQAAEPQGGNCAATDAPDTRASGDERLHGALQLVAKACTGRQPRLVSAAIMLNHRIIAVGDVNGGVCAFAFPQSLLEPQLPGTQAQGPLQLQLVAKLDCHGNTPVTMVKCVGSRVLTGGRNGAHHRATGALMCKAPGWP
jgi:hypothetical protein